jgi:hypothetical protein
MRIHHVSNGSLERTDFRAHLAGSESLLEVDAGPPSEVKARRFTYARGWLAMPEQVCVINRRPCRRFSTVKYALSALRYVVTGIVGLFLALLLGLVIVECGAAIGAALEHVRENAPASGNLWRVGVECDSSPGLYG